MQALIREVIATHSGEYAPAEGWQDGVVAAMKGLMPPAVWGWLDPLLTPFVGKTTTTKEGDQDKGKPAKPVDPGQLGL